MISLTYTVRIRNAPLVLDSGSNSVISHIEESHPAL